MKNAKLAPHEKLTGVLSAADPFINSLDHMGQKFVGRHRDASKETSAKTFNLNIKMEEREQAFLSKNQVGSIRQARNKKARDLLRQYQDGGEAPSCIENNSYMKGPNSFAEAGMNTLLDAMNEGVHDRNLSITKCEMASNEVTDREIASLDIISEGINGQQRALGGSNSGQLVWTSHEKLPSMPSQGNASKRKTAQEIHITSANI